MPASAVVDTSPDEGSRLVLGTNEQIIWLVAIKEVTPLNNSAMNKTSIVRGHRPLGRKSIAFRRSRVLVPAGNGNLTKEVGKKVESDVEK